MIDLLRVAAVTAFLDTSARAEGTAKNRIRSVEGPRSRITERSPPTVGRPGSARGENYQTNPGSPRVAPARRVVRGRRITKRTARGVASAGRGPNYETNP